MKQAQILALLQEAAQVGCRTERREWIRDELYGELTFPPQHDPDIEEARGICEGIGRVLGYMYQDTLNKRPDQLIVLFPLFAAICGDREPDQDFATIDWSLVPPLAK